MSTSVLRKSPKQDITWPPRQCPFCAASVNCDYIYIYIRADENNTDYLFHWALKEEPLSVIA